VSRAACAWRAGHGELAGPRRNAFRSKPIAIAPGTACIFRREVLERERLRRALRFLSGRRRPGPALPGKGDSRGVYVPDSRGVASWQRDFRARWDARVVRLISRNQLMLVSRHYDRALLRSCLWPILAGQFLWGLVALRHGAGMRVAGRQTGWPARTFDLEGLPSPPLCAISWRCLGTGDRGSAPAILIGDGTSGLRRARRIDTWPVSQSSSLPGIRPRRSAVVSTLWLVYRATKSRWSWWIMRPPTRRVTWRRARVASG
jgi:hypothetical protein